MNKWVRAGGVVLAMVVVIVVVLSFKVFGGPETVSRAEFQSYRGEVNSSITKMADSVLALAKATETGFGQMRGDIKDINNDRKTEKAVQEKQDQLDAEKAGRVTDALRAKDAELERSLAEMKASLQPNPQSWQAYSGTVYLNGNSGFNVGQSADYIILLNPPMPGTSISIDSRSVYNGQVVCLTQGWHTCYSSFPVQVSWRLN